MSLFIFLPDEDKSIVETGCVYWSLWIYVRVAYKLPGSSASASGHTGHQSSSAIHHKTNMGYVSHDHYAGLAGQVSSCCLPKTAQCKKHAVAH